MGNRIYDTNYLYITEKEVMHCMNPILAILLCVVALVIGAALSGYIAFKKGVEAGIEKRKQQAESVMGSADGIVMYLCWREEICRMSKIRN